MTVTLATMAFIFGSADVVNGSPMPSGAQGSIALVAANLLVIVFGMSWGPVVWVLLGEMFQNRMQAAALSLAAGGQWVANWVITVSFPGLKDVSLALAYGPYAGFALLSLLFVMRFIQETEGKQLEDCRDERGLPSESSAHVTTRGHVDTQHQSRSGPGHVGGRPRPSGPPRPTPSCSTWTAC